MLALPRSARLVAWTNAWLVGGALLDEVVDRVTGDDEPHRVSGAPGGLDAIDLASALRRLRADGEHRMHLALPRPGDPLGVVGRVDLTGDAVVAGEAAVAPRAGVALVPQVDVFGPPGDEGHLVTWRWYGAEPGADIPDLVEAERALQESLIAAAAELARLDVAAWRPEVAALLEDVRSGRSAEPLPRLYPPRAQALAAQAARLRAVVQFALGDDGGAVSLGAATHRRDALRPLEAAARRALVAACAATEIR